MPDDGSGGGVSNGGGDRGLGCVRALHPGAMGSAASSQNRRIGRLLADLEADDRRAEVRAYA